jgi:predicted secreted protein
MKRAWLGCVLLLTCSAFGQYVQIGSVFPTGAPAAATPTFSPVAGAVTNPTTVTASTATVDGCTMYLDTSNPPTTAQSTYSVTTGVTLYAQAKGCSTHTDSAVASAAYTITCTSGACSDSFVGTNGTLLTTHDPQWTALSTYTVSGATLNGSGSVVSNTQNTGAYYAASTSDTSVVVIRAGTGAGGKGVFVRGSSSSGGYLGDFGNNSGGNYGYIYYFKNFVQVNHSAALGLSQSSDWCLKAVASGTSTVTVTYSTAPFTAGNCGSYTLWTTETDSSSPLPAGHPGIVIDNNYLSSANSALGLWSDH